MPKRLPGTKSFMWTKENIKTLMKLWEAETVEGIGEKMNLNKTQVQYMANNIRKMGYPLAKKHNISQTKALVEETMKELGIKPGYSGNLAVKR